MSIEYYPFQINEHGHLAIGGVDTVELAETYGTPLNVYDVDLIRKRCRTFVNTFKQLGVNANVSYASKAFSSIAILQIIKEEGLGLDVVSDGELFTALQADFPAENIQFHGNNKSIDELTMALDYGVGTIVVDNFYEITLLEKLAREKNKQVNVFIRLTPGIESETHRYILTGNEDSKFGFNLQNGQADKALKRLHNHPYLHLRGLHSHIGSQIFSADSYRLAVKLLFEFIQKWHNINGFTPAVLNVGGGFGIRYTETDQPLAYEKHVKAIVEQVKLESEKVKIPLPDIWIEPGRAIVGEAGITLYRVGSMKHIEGVRHYVSVDGGMADNIRPALYDAKYDAIIANKASERKTETISIAGKACESGDMLVWDVRVPKIEHDDIVALFATGAYGYAMASNYNKLRRPAVVFVEKGKAQLVVKRETFEDLVKNDLPYKI